MESQQALLSFEQHAAAAFLLPAASQEEHSAFLLAQEASSREAEARPMERRRIIERVSVGNR
ncbi:hypothetical protein GCM10023213_42920 [Prosthecobacter algae]|uniref:Uncharacterized protein n=1 Tax=Prosthecobacter algae TaxID=1144682 RepID=A0ABP9PMY4_9BACT